MTTIPAVTLDALSNQINAEHEKARIAFTEGFAHALKAGHLLLEAKDRVQHGEWLPWLRENCKVSERTARLYMQVARERDRLERETASLADLTLEGAVRHLAEPKPGSVAELRKTGVPIPTVDSMLFGVIDFGKGGRNEAHVLPSDYDDFFHIIVMLFAEEDGGGFAIYTDRPVRTDAIDTVLNVQGFDTLRAEWERQPTTDRHTRNPLMCDRKAA